MCASLKGQRSQGAVCPGPGCLSGAARHRARAVRQYASVLVEALGLLRENEWTNPDRNFYEAHPAFGGPRKWVNRKMLVREPRGEAHALPGMDGAPADEDIVANSVDREMPGRTVAPHSRLARRRSSQSNKGQHSHPAHIPRSHQLVDTRWCGMMPPR